MPVLKKLFRNHPSCRVFFYSHPHLRDRQLDTIRNWPPQQLATNPKLQTKKRGAQVPREKALTGNIIKTWKTFIPLMNLKWRPVDAPADAAVYVWGAIISHGKFISDLDNPYSLVGYNYLAMALWRPIISAILRSSRCIQIRCLSEACRDGVRQLFGEAAAQKSVVVYPHLKTEVPQVQEIQKPGPRLLFIGTQFEIKGGPELLHAFPSIHNKIPGVTLDIITHLPGVYKELADQEGVTVHEAVFSRHEIWTRFMRNADILVHPSYIESFGMVIFEALAHGLAVVANDVYAHREMVIDGYNGYLLEPPVKYWNEDDLAGPLFKNQNRASDYIRSHDMSDYIERLATAITRAVNDEARLLSLRQDSCAHFRDKFSTLYDREAEGYND